VPYYLTNTILLLHLLFYYFPYRISSKEYWIGLKYTWAWLDGTAKTYSNWYQDEPLNNELYCATLGTAGTWTTQGCGSSYIGLCAAPGLDFQLHVDQLLK
jgi:hypothetical protein